MWFYMSPLKFKFEFKFKRNDDHRADSLFPNSVIVLSCILAFFQIRTYVRNPALRSTTSFKHFLLLELFCKIGQSHKKEWTQITFPGHMLWGQWCWHCKKTRWRSQSPSGGRKEGEALQKWFQKSEISCAPKISQICFSKNFLQNSV